jgi:hypothetical protein
MELAAGGCGGSRHRHVLETHSYSHAVPLKREVLAFALAVPPVGFGLGGGAEKRIKSHGTPEIEVEREGCRTKECSLPGVSSYDAGASS